MPIPPTPLPGELRRALDQLRKDISENATGVRSVRHTVSWHGERLDRIEQTDRAPAPVAQQPDRSAVDFDRLGVDTQTIILKVLEDRRAKEALKTVDAMKGFGGSLAKTVITIGVVAVLGVLATVLVLQAARTMGEHHEASHGAHEP